MFWSVCVVVFLFVCFFCNLVCFLFVCLVFFVFSGGGGNEVDVAQFTI